MHYNLQLLRAIAAYAVVAHHILQALRDNIAIGRFFASPHFGATGVNVFFVISGFIMALTTARPITPGEFVYHRVVRIVPVYWLLTALTLILIAAGFAMFGHHEGPDWIEAVTSFLFIPDIRPGGDLPIPPALFVGWSLTFEMMFYAIFAAALILRSDRLTVVIGAVVALWLAHLLSSNEYVRWLGGDIILGFALGVLIWQYGPAINSTTAFVLIPASVLILTTPDFFTHTVMATHWELVVTAGAGLLVLAAVGLERHGLHIGKGWLSAQGDASYSLYFVHPFVLRAIGKLAVRTGTNQSVSGLCLTVLLMMAASIVAATAFHRLLERPLTGVLRRDEPVEQPS